MGSYMLLEFVGTLREAQKLFFSNVKLMSCIILPIISLSSVLLVSNIFFIKWVLNVILNAILQLQLALSSGNPEFPDPNTLKYDLRLFAGLEWVFIYSFGFAYLFFATASILASSIKYRRQDLSVKELLSRTVKSLEKPFLTRFYTTLLHLGYCLFLIGFLLPLVLLFDLTFTAPAFPIILFLLALVFESYLAVVWNLALVVSVLEKKCGVEALGKAGQLIKGSKLRGFFLNLLFGAFSLSEFYGLYKIVVTDMSANAAIILLPVLNSISCLMRMFMLMAYTVLYHDCNETHGRVFDMQGSIEFSKVAVSPLISADVP